MSSSSDSSHDSGEGADRRAELVENAIAQLARGYGQASLHRIAAASGVSVGLIAYHFGNKEGLFQAVREHVVGLALAVMVPRITATSTAREGLHALITSNLEFMALHPTELTALVELIRHDIVTGHGSSDVPSGVRDVETLLRWGQDRGEFRDFDALGMAATIRSAIDQIPQMLSYRPDLDLAAFGEELAELFDRATRT